MTLTPKARLILVLTVLVVSAAAVAALLEVRRGQQRTHAAEARAAGLAAYASGDFSAAITHLSTSLRSRPDDVEAIFAFAQSRRQVPLPKDRHLTQTVTSLRRVLTIDPDHEQAHRQLLKIYETLGYATEVLNTVEWLLKKDKQDWSALSARTGALMALKRTDEAFAAAQETAKLHPTRLEAHLAVIHIMRALNKVVEVRQYPGTLPAEWGSEMDMALLRAVAYQLSGETADALKWLRLAAEKPVKDVQVFKQVLDRLDMAGDLEFATKTLQDRSESLGGDTGLRVLYAYRMWQTASMDVTLKLLEPVKPEDAAADAQLLALKAIVAIAGKDSETAEKITAALESRKTEAARAWAVMLRQVLLVKQPDPRKVAGAAEEAVALFPGDPLLRFFLAESLIHTNNRNAALREYRRVSQMAPAWPAPMVRLARHLINSGEYPEALAAAEQAMKRGPRDMEAATVSALAAYRIGPPMINFAGLLRFVQGVRQAAPMQWELLPLEAHLLVRTRDRAGAVQLFKQIIEAEKAPPPGVFIQLADVDRQYNLGVAEALLKRAETAHGISPSIAYAQAVFAYKADSIEQAFAVFKDFWKRSKASEKDPAWRIAHASLLELVGDPAAGPIWAALAEELPDDLAVQRAVLMSRSVGNMRELIDRSIDRIRQLSSEDSAEWRLARARWIINGSQGSESMARAALLLHETVRLEPNSFQARVMLAACMQSTGNIRGALEQLKAAAAIDPSAAGVHIHIGILEQRQGNYVEAAKHFALLSEREDLTVSQRRTLGSLWASQGESARAIQMLEATPDTDKDPLLAELYWREGKPAKVEPILRHLLSDRASLNPRLIRFAAAFFSSQNEPEKALAALHRLDELNLTNGSAELLRAEYHGRIGDFDAARKQHVAATAKAPDEPNTWLQRLIFEVRRENFAEFIAAAHQAKQRLPREQAFALAVQHSDVVQAAIPSAMLRPLIITLISDADNTAIALDALRLGVQIGSARPTSDQLVELNKLASAHPRLLSLQTFAAGVYTMLGQHDEATRVATRAMGAFPTSAEPAALAALSLAAADRWPETLTVAREWRQRSLTLGQSVQADQMLAESYLQLRQPVEAIKQLQVYVESAVTDPTNQGYLLVLYGRSLLAAGRYREAEDLIWPLVLQNVQWRGVWRDLAASFIPELAVATNWLQRIENPQAPLDEQMRLTAAWAQLAQRFNNKPMLAQSQERLSRLAADEKATPDILSAFAVMKEAGGDVAAAEAAYRRLIKLAPTDARAYNNLAMLLARQERNLDEAASLAARAQELMPENVSVLDTLALVQVLTGQDQQALTTIERGLKLQPEHLSLLTTRFWAAAKLGKMNDAQEQYRRLSSVFTEGRQVPADLRDRFTKAKSLLKTL